MCKHEFCQEMKKYGTVQNVPVDEIERLTDLARMKLPELIGREHVMQYLAARQLLDRNYGLVGGGKPEKEYNLWSGK